MTYDLTLKGKLDEDKFVEYFQRENWTFPEDDPDVAAYFNPSTGVYFHVRFDEALHFSINLFRNRGFVLEAHLALKIMCEDLDLTVEDPQGQGIEGDRYNGDQFLRGWDHANAWAHRSAKRDGASCMTYDGLAIEAVWEWNFGSELIENDNGGHYTALPIRFVKVGERVQTMGHYEAGSNALLPRTDLVALIKDEQRVVVGWSAVEEALGLVDGDKVDDPLDYWALLDLSISRKLAPFWKKGHPTIAVEPCPFEDVHAREDFE
jgi:hypothetical protein